MTARSGPLGTLTRRSLPRLETRLVAGGMLFVVVFTGNLVFWRAGRITEPVLVAAREIAAGERIEADDLAVVEARLEGTTAALAVPAPAIGEVLGRMSREPIRAGELLAREALGAAPAIGRDQVAVTVPVAAEAVYPRLHPGSAVVVFGTAERQMPQSRTIAVVERAVVYDVGVQADALAFGPNAPSAGGRVVNVTLIVPRTSAEELAHALANWQLTLVLLPDDAPAGQATAGSAAGGAR